PPPHSTFSLPIPPTPRSTLFPYTTLFRSAITTDLKAKMFSEPALKSANLNVTTKDGVVTLTGEVPDDTARLAAYKLASEEKGVADRKSTRLNSSHVAISYAVFCLKKKNKK